MKKTIYILIILFCKNNLFAQPKITYEAYQYYQEKNLAKAKELIEVAIENKQGMKDPLTWQIRGFIFKDLFNKEEGSQGNDKDRENAISSIQKSIEYDTKKEYEENNLKALKFLGISYYNDVVLTIRNADTVGLPMADNTYAKYKTVYASADPGFDFKEKDISFYKAIATCYRKIYEENRVAKKSYFTKAINYYKQVILLDPENYGANYNLAVNLYNEGAYKIEQISADDQIPTIVKIQSSSIELFKQALPYMLKAHSLNQEREETLKGLRGIYLSLSEDAEANKYKELLLNKQQAGNK